MLIPITLVEKFQKSDAIVLGVFQSDEKSDNPSFKILGGKNKNWEALEKKLKESRHFLGKKNETSVLRYYAFDEFPNTILLGLGKPEGWTAELARQAGASLFQIQKAAKFSSVFLLGETVFHKPKSADYDFQAFCEGYWLSGYEYRELKKSKEGDGEKKKVEPKELLVSGLPKSLQKSMDKARPIVESINFARSLGDKPGNYLTPAILGDLVEKAAKDVGLKCQVLGRKEIEKEKMGLLLGVSLGSEEEPRLIVMQHQGGNKSANPVVLIGKGITFDSGGISLKPSAKMEEMKYDMMGAATVAAVCLAAAELDLPVNIVGVIAASENLPDGKAQKPGDVAISLSGKTVEIINTDAEGRLVLADAIEYVQKHFKPQAMVDMATLTGAVIEALGKVTTGIMGTSPELIERIKKASELTGEKVWELPLYEEYEEEMKSNFADIKNTGERGAGSSKGGAFLKFFVDSKIPWAHCDIAGTSYFRKDLNYNNGKFGAGVLVRLMVQMLEDWKPLKA